MRVCREFISVLSLESFWFYGNYNRFLIRSLLLLVLGELDVHVVELSPPRMTHKSVHKVNLGDEGCNSMDSEYVPF